MICPNCGIDYKDVPTGKIPGHFYRSDSSYNQKERRYGIQCTNCGFVGEWIAKATGNPYRKRENHIDVNQIDLFDNDELSLNEIQKIIGDEAAKEFSSNRMIINQVKEKLISLTLSPSDENGWIEIFELVLAAAHKNKINLMESVKEKLKERV